MKTMNLTKWTMSAVAMGMMGGCLEDANGRGLALTQGQLEERLVAGPQRLEVSLRADGSVREVHLEDEGPGHDEQFSGKLVSVDAASSTLEIEYLGTVDFAAAGRFRTDEESRVERASWFASVEGALAGGQAVWLEARGRFGVDEFVANELRWEGDTKREVEADVEAGDFDEASGTLTVGWLTFDIRGAQIRVGDDSDDINDDSDGSDDNGSDASGSDDDGRDGRSDDDGSDDRGGDTRDAGPSDDDGDDNDDDGDDDDGDDDDGDDSDDNDGDDDDSGDDNDGDDRDDN